MDKARMQRTLKRMAIQVWERLNDKEEVVLIGLNERGMATANELALHLNKRVKKAVKVYQYTVLDSDSKKGIPDCNDKFVLLVDDVIFSGKTMFEALSAVCSINEPASIEIAVLLDRGHRRYPLRTDLTGIKTPTKLGEHIEVMLKHGTLEQAVLFKN
ncbi:MAG: phosphoribosyltransferase family protein [Balneolaceae bacterium]